MEASEFREHMWMMVHAISCGVSSFVEPFIDESEITRLQMMVLDGIKCGKITTVKTMSEFLCLYLMQEVRNGRLFKKAEKQRRSKSRELTYYGKGKRSSISYREEDRRGDDACIRGNGRGVDADYT